MSVIFHICLQEILFLKSFVYNLDFRLKSSKSEQIFSQPQIALHRNKTSSFCCKTRCNSLIDTIASSNGYRWKRPSANLLTHSETPNLEIPHLDLTLQQTPPTRQKLQSIV